MPIRIAIVGYGSAGRQHIEAIKAVKEAELYCVYDEKANIVDDNLIKKESWASLLEDTKIDAIALCIPPGERNKLAYEALEAGKSILLEKPPFNTEHELNKLLIGSEEYNKTVGVMLQHRFRLPKEVLSWKWNEKTTATLEVSRPRDKDKYFKEWRLHPEKSFGGIISHLGVHYLDLACLLLGEPKIINPGVKREIRPGLDLRTTGTIEFINGSSLSFSITCEVKKRKERLVIYGEDSTLIVEDGIVSYEKDGYESASDFVETKEMRIKVYEDFVKAIKENRQPKLCHIDGARGVTKILEQFHSKAVYY